eukprot:CAMPEP_0183335690 /NCGR_PEP_ID=MMETSP0164_2-20130417/3913_1 /TAXON_ID=221442 /ORGANISM="Coccolithus pelagicus ssp braarudi, Strain PLY182g" /LENGTH=97 /DNA_ID=CAMNT_0025505095 /DNA_START=354 /DNA_END=643 /DNA_ORIENTATION=-
MSRLDGCWGRRRGLCRRLANPLPALGEAEAPGGMTCESTCERHIKKRAHGTERGTRSRRAVPRSEVPTSGGLTAAGGGGAVSVAVWPPPPRPPPPPP